MQLELGQTTVCTYKLLMHMPLALNKQWLSLYTVIEVWNSHDLLALLILL